MTVLYEINAESAISCINFENIRPMFSKHLVNRLGKKKAKQENPTPKLLSSKRQGLTVEEWVFSQINVIPVFYRSCALCAWIAVCAFQLQNF